MHQDVFLDLHPLSNIVNLYLENIRLVIDNKVAIGKIIDVFPMHVIDLLNALFSIEDFITYFIVPTILVQLGGVIVDLFLNTSCVIGILSFSVTSA